MLIGFADKSAPTSGLPWNLYRYKQSKHALSFILFSSGLNVPSRDTISCLDISLGFVTTAFPLYSYLITGCSRGFSLEFVKQLREAPDSFVKTVIATARSPAALRSLEEQIKASEGRFHYVPLNVTNGESIGVAVQQIIQLLGSSGLDVLINNVVINIAGTGEVSDMCNL